MDPANSSTAPFGSSDGNGKPAINVSSIETVSIPECTGRCSIPPIKTKIGSVTGIVRLKGFRWTLGVMSNELKRQALHQYVAPDGMTGAMAAVRIRPSPCAARVFEQYVGPVKGQATF